MAAEVGVQAEAGLPRDLADGGGDVAEASSWLRRGDACLQGPFGVVEQLRVVG